MYDDIRQVTISGGATNDSQLAYTNSGTPVLKFNLGSSESRKNQQGGYDKKSHYTEIVFWGKYAETLVNHIKRGTKLVVSGKLEFQQWESNGDKRSKHVINADSVKIESNGNQQGQQSNQNTGGYNQTNPTYTKNQGNNSYNNQGGSGNFEDSNPF